MGDTGQTPYMGYKNKTNPEWLPKDIHHSVKTFIESVDHNLQEETHVTTPERKPNLTKGEIQSLCNLKERNDIIITKADKGGAVVIINVDDYLKEAKCRLDNTEFYQKLNQDLTETHAEIVNETITKFAKEKLLKVHVAISIDNL